MDEAIVERLVLEWDDVYKKGQLSFWVLLAIYEKRKYAVEITEFMKEVSNGDFEVKEQSLYRALRRFKSMGLVTISEEDSPNSGPKRKYYGLSAIGIAVLKEFTVRNIKPLNTPKIISLLHAVESEAINYENN